QTWARTHLGVGSTVDAQGYFARGEAPQPSARHNRGVAADFRVRQAVRAALGVLAVGALVALLLHDNTGPDPQADRPSAVSETEPEPDRSVSSPPSLPTPPPPRRPGGPREEAVPPPPPGLQTLVCAQFTQPHRLRLLSFNTRRSEGPAGTLEAIAAEIRDVQP